MTEMAAGLARGAGAPASLEIAVTSPGRLAARGVLTFANARGARNDGLQALRAASAHDLEMDCAGITHSDSAGLAVLLDWLAAVKREGRPLRFTHLPQGLLALARISGVEEMLQKGV